MEKDGAQDPSSTSHIFHPLLTTMLMSKHRVLTAVVKVNVSRVKSWILFGQWHGKGAGPPSTGHARARYKYKNFSYPALQRKKRQRRTQLPVTAHTPDRFCWLDGQFV